MSKVMVRGELYEIGDLTRQQVDCMRVEAGIDNDTCPLCHDSDGKFFMRIIANVERTFYPEEAGGVEMSHKCICLVGRPALTGNEKRKQRDLMRLGLGKIDTEWLKEVGLWQGREYEPKKRRSFEKEDMVLQYKDD